MGGRGGDFNFFQGIHVRIDIRIDISISIRPAITKFDKQVHLQDLIQMRPNQARDGDVIMSGLRDKLNTLYFH